MTSDPQTIAHVVVLLRISAWVNGVSMPNHMFASMGNTLTAMLRFTAITAPNGLNGNTARAKMPT